MQRDLYCGVCSGRKVKEIKTVVNYVLGNAYNYRIEDCLYTLQGGEILNRVYCPNCGIIYHEESI